MVLIQEEQILFEKLQEPEKVAASNAESFKMLASLQEIIR